MVVKKQHVILALLFVSSFLIAHSAFSMKRPHEDNLEIIEPLAKKRRIDNNCQFAKDKHMSPPKNPFEKRDPWIQEPTKRTRQQ